MKAEMRIVDEENITQTEKKEKFRNIQNQYDQLLTFSKSRQEGAKNNIEKMKKSKDPIRQAAGFDIEIAIKDANAKGYQSEIEEYHTMIKSLKDAGKTLSPEDQVVYDLKIGKLTEKIKKI